MNYGIIDEIHSEITGKRCMVTGFVLFAGLIVSPITGNATDATPCDRSAQPCAKGTVIQIENLNSAPPAISMPYSVQIKASQIPSPPVLYAPKEEPKDE